jgi:hypothetical protein
MLRLRLVLIVGLVVSGCDLDPAPPIVVGPLREARLDPNAIPQTLDEALGALRDGLSGQDFHSMQRLNEDAAIEAFYRRNRGKYHRWQAPWPLEREGSMRRELAVAGFQHADDMAEAILRSFWRRLHDRPIDLAGQVREANARREETRRQGPWAVVPEKSAERLVGRCEATSPTFEGTWTPDEEIIRTLEDALPSALTRATFRTAMPLDASVPPLSDYYRQYVGLIRRGKKAVYINGFHRRYAEDTAASPKESMSWRKIPISVCDGGHDFFGGEYDVEARRFRYIAFD